MTTKKFIVLAISDFREHGVPGRITPLINKVGEFNTKEKANNKVSGSNDNMQYLIIEFGENIIGRIVNLDK